MGNQRKSILTKTMRCYLDKRRKCFHPSLAKFCENQLKICNEMKPFCEEWHEILESETLLKKHPELRNKLQTLEEIQQETS